MINATRPGRVLVIITMIAATLVLLVGAVYGMWTSACGNQWEVIVFLMFMISIWFLIMVRVVLEVPEVFLTEMGITVRFLFWKQGFAWNEIVQAGILHRVGRGVPNPDFILLLPGGSPRREQDSFFLLRNQRKILHICVSAEICNFVIQHYGPLDFDLANGS